SAGAERGAPAARQRTGSARGPAIVNTANQLTAMTKTSNVCVTLLFAAALAAPAAAQAVNPGPGGIGPIGRGPGGPPPGVALRRERVDERAAERAREMEDRADELYNDGREAIEEGKYDKALDKFERLIDMKTNRTDAALYWKAYSLGKLGRRADALSALADL